MAYYGGTPNIAFMAPYDGKWRNMPPFFFDFFDNPTQNFMLISNIQYFQWLFVYFKRYGLESCFWSIFLAKLKQFFFCLKSF